MKLKWKIIVAVLVLFTVTLPVFFDSFFVPFSGSCIAEITLVRNKTVKHKAIYPTRLLSVDPVQKTVEIEVEFPNHEWKRFHGKENTRIEGLGYIVGKVEADQVEISMLYPDSGWKFKYW